MTHCGSLAYSTPRRHGGAGDLHTYSVLDLTCEHSSVRAAAVHLWTPKERTAVSSRSPGLAVSRSALCSPTNADTPDWAVPKDLAAGTQCVDCLPRTVSCHRHHDNTHRHTHTSDQIRSHHITTYHSTAQHGTAWDRTGQDKTTRTATAAAVQTTRPRPHGPRPAVCTAPATWQGDAPVTYCSRPSRNKPLCMVPVSAFASTNSSLGHSTQRTCVSVTHPG